MNKTTVNILAGLFTVAVYAGACRLFFWWSSLDLETAISYAGPIMVGVMFVAAVFLFVVRVSGVRVRQ